MNFEKIKTEGMKHEYNVTLSAKDIESHIMDAVSQKAKTFKMHGFRPGHVPLDIVRKNTEGLVLQNVLDTLISDACNVIIKELAAGDLATRPTYKFDSAYEPGKDVTLTLYIETAPSFELKDFKTKINKVIPNVTDKDIEQTKQNLVKKDPIFEKANKDYAIQPGDRVSYSAECLVNGVKSKKKSFENSITIPFEIPSDAEFLQGFVGKKIHETFDFAPATEKNTIYKFTVKSIKKALRDIPFDEYAKKKGFRNDQELCDAIRKNLENAINDTAFIYHKHQILNFLADEYSFDLPQTIVEQETKNVVANIKKELENEKRKGAATEADLKKTDEDFRKEYEAVIKKRVLLGYVLNKFAKKYNIGITDNELKSSILEEARKNPAIADHIIAYYTSNHNAVAYRKAEILEKKVIQHLISLAEYNEVSKTLEEVNKLVDEILENE